MKTCVNILILSLFYLEANGFVQSPTLFRVQTFVNSQPGVGLDVANDPSSTQATYRADSWDGSSPRTSEEVWETISPVPVQGSSLRTCSFEEHIDRVEVHLRTEGRPLNANVELWQGPDNSPQRVQVYLEDGFLRPFRSVIESPGDSNAIAIRNTGQLEFPLAAAVDPMESDNNPAMILSGLGAPRTVQGGAVFTTPFAPSVASVQIMLKSDGRPLNARIELLQGPNNNKQVMEVYSEDGLERPFFAIMDTPGSGNVVRLVNTATVEFPLFASVEPYMVESFEDSSPEDPTMIWT